MSWRSTACAVGLPLHPGQFATLGLSFVHQDLGLLRELTVLENLRMIELAQSHSWRINWRAERRKARALFEEFGVDLDPDALVNDISETDRALLAIVRATEDIRTATGEDRRGLLVLDEPTVFLPREGVERLFAITRSIVEERASVLFVGHDLDEVREITDVVTVLRDGRVHGTVKTAEASEGEMVEMIIGRRLAQLELHREDASTHATAISVEGMIGTKVRALSWRSTPARCSASPGCWAPASTSSPTCCSARARASAASCARRGRRTRWRR